MNYSSVVNNPFSRVFLLSLGLGLFLSACTTNSDPVGNLDVDPQTMVQDIMVSKSSDRSDAVPLDTAEIDGNIYAFVTGKSIKQVAFYLNDTKRRAKALQVEKRAPFDFSGTEDSTSRAQAFNTKTLKEGMNRLTTVITYSNGRTKVATASFNVNNDKSDDSAGGILFSKSAERTGAKRLEGSAVSGNAYIFVIPEGSVKEVKFYLDGKYYKRERYAFYDFAGTHPSGQAQAFNTSKVAAGAHTLKAVVTSKSGKTTEINARFSVGKDSIDNPDPAPTKPTPPPSAPVSYPEDSYYKQRAFPGAEGYGANATGGRGGRIEFITNRNNSGSGSAREAFEGSGKRYVIPLVWGYVDLQDGFDVNNGEFTYAGQFMPEGKGLAFRNMRKNSWGSAQQTVVKMKGAKNVILRYLKIYRGVHSSYPDKGSCLSINDTPDVIVDHSAMAFCNDEEIGIWGDDTQRVTVQHTWPIMPLHYSTHPKTLDNGIEHGMGILAGGDAGHVSLHHNFFYLNDMRTPRLSGRHVYDVVNNYDYNTNSPIQITQDNEPAKSQATSIKANVIKNLREHGPYSKRTRVSFGMWIYQQRTDEAIPSAYLQGNIHPYRKAGDSEWAGVKEGNNKKPIRLSSRVSAPLVRTTDPYEAKDDILNWGGPSYVMRGGKMVNVRDDLLSTAAKNARNGTGPDRALSRNNFSYPSLPSGGISEGQFWNDYFNPWRDTYYPGKDWDDYVEGYQIIEHFLNAWVPNFPEESF